MKKIKNTNAFLIALAGIIVSFALSCNILVADDELAQNSYGAQLIQYDYTNALATEPSLAIDIIKFKQLLDGSDTMTMASIAFGFSFVLWWIVRKKLLQKSRSVILVSICFGIVQVFGLSLYELENWDFVFANRFQLIVSLICILGYTLLGYVGIVIALYLLDCFSKMVYKQSGTKNNKGLLIGRHPLLYSFLIIVLFWSPYVIFSYPGSLAWDSSEQIAQGVGIIAYDSHHPIVSSFIHGFCVKIGEGIGNPNFGLFLYVMLQMTICAFAFSLIIYCYIGLKLPNKLIYLLLAYYSILPIWGGYMQAVIKDTLFMGVYTVFITLGIYTYNRKLLCKERLMIALLIITGLFVCLLRNNGSYAAIPGTIIFLAGYYGKKHIKKAFVLFSLMILLLGAVRLVTNEKSEIPSDKAKESLSICYQQTAYCIKYFRDEISEEDENIIDAVLDFESIGDKYCYWLSDSVKETYKYPSNNELIEYLKVWAKMFMKHPLSYIKATNANTYGYYTIVGNRFWKDKEEYFFYMCGANNMADAYGFDYAFPSEVRLLIYDLCLVFDDIPLVGLLTNIGFYTWLGVIMFLWIFINNRRNVWIFVPNTLLLLTCIASPGVILRYYLPIMATMPILLIGLPMDSDA